MSDMTHFPHTNMHQISCSITNIYTLQHIYSGIFKRSEIFVPLSLSLLSFSFPLSLSFLLFLYSLSFSLCLLLSLVDFFFLGYLNSMSLTEKCHEQHPSNVNIPKKNV